MASPSVLEWLSMGQETANDRSSQSSAPPVNGSLATEFDMAQSHAEQSNPYWSRRSSTDGQNSPTNSFPEHCVLNEVEGPQTAQISQSGLSQRSAKGALPSIQSQDSDDLGNLQAIKEANADAIPIITGRLLDRRKEREAELAAMREEHSLLHSRNASLEATTASQERSPRDDLSGGSSLRTGDAEGVLGTDPWPGLAEACYKWMINNNQAPGDLKVFDKAWDGDQPITFHVSCAKVCAATNNLRKSLGDLKGLVARREAVALWKAAKEQNGGASVELPCGNGDPSHEGTLSLIQSGSGTKPDAGSDQPAGQLASETLQDESESSDGSSSHKPDETYEGDPQTESNYVADDDDDPGSTGSDYER